MAIITISRLTGSGGREIATALAEIMGFQFVDRDTIDTVIPSPSQNVVMLGGGGQFLFSKVLASLHVQIVAPLPNRIARVMRFAGVNREGAEKIIQARDEAKRHFIAERFGADWRDPSLYDLVLNLDRFSNEVAVQIIKDIAKTKAIDASDAGLTPLADAEGKQQVFAHSSEREFASVMDFYKIRWEYEPKTFPIEWDEDNNVIAAFTPDFYLPDLDLFIELTTMKQSLVTKKNRKARRLRELHPEINIKILYERDYRNLIWKYGLSAPEAEENGSRKIS